MLVMLAIGVIVLIVVLAGLRGLFRPRRMRQTPPYADYDRSYGYDGPYGYGHRHGGYGPPQRSGMGSGTAGALGAVGGGLLGYELGKMEGEQQQFHHDELLMQQRDDYGPDVGGWVDQGGDFGDSGMGWGDGDGSW